MRKIIKKLLPKQILNSYRNFKKQKKIKLYAGENVMCPICKSKFKNFAPFGSENREDAKCLACGSLERDRLIWMYLNAKTKIFDNVSRVRLLHFAPEKVFYDIFSQNQNIEYFPCDLYAETFEYKNRIKINTVDITNIPYKENYFDVILCNHVLEHIPDDRLAMSELYRVMKPEGWGIFQAPIDYSLEQTYEDFTITTSEEREMAFGQNDHVRRYGWDYTDRLVSVGFDVTKLNYVKSFSSQELIKFGILPSEIIFHCRKLTVPNNLIQ